MSERLNVRCFTTTYPGITGVLITDVIIAKAFYPEKGEQPSDSLELKALWDTGATHSVITQNVVNECKLKPVGITKVNTAAGENTCPVFLVGMGLPNNVMFNQIRVTLGQLAGNIDVLIGMDIIHRGDFAISNCNGQTIFSFRLPSVDVIDFVKEQKKQSDTAPNAGRNNPCPCGSGKKYKHCHGKN